MKSKPKNPIKKYGSVKSIILPFGEVVERREKRVQVTKMKEVRYCKFQNGRLFCDGKCETCGFSDGFRDAFIFGPVCGDK
jgi:hypothetical protein